MTWIGTAEFDPLRDEGEAYADKIKEAGNTVVLKRYSGVPHPFMHMDRVLPQGREYVQDVIRVIRSCLHTKEEGEDGKDDTAEKADDDTTMKE